jgi:hypothetical protein
MSPGSCTVASVSDPDNGALGTLEDALKWFSVPSNSTACLVRKRWPDGIVRCPSCGGTDVRYLASRNLWECRAKHPKSQFRIRAGTIFEDSHIAVGLWLTAIWMVANLSKPSSHEMARRLGITQKSAWSMLRRIKCAREAAKGGASLQSEVSVRDRGSLLRE